MFGFELTTLTRYALPAGVPIGMFAFMVPFDVELRVPIVNGDEKFPEASDSCTENVLVNGVFVKVQLLV